MPVTVQEVAYGFHVYYCGSTNLFDRRAKCVAHEGDAPLREPDGRDHCGHRAAIVQPQRAVVEALEVHVDKCSQSSQRQDLLDQLQLGALRLAGPKRPAASGAAARVDGKFELGPGQETSQVLLEPFAHIRLAQLATRRVHERRVPGTLGSL